MTETPPLLRPASILASLACLGLLLVMAIEGYHAETQNLLWSLINIIVEIWLVYLIYQIYRGRKWGRTSLLIMTGFSLPSIVMGAAESLSAVRLAVVPQCLGLASPPPPPTPPTFVFQDAYVCATWARLGELLLWDGLLLASVILLFSPASRAYFSVKDPKPPAPLTNNWKSRNGKLTAAALGLLLLLFLFPVLRMVWLSYAPYFSGR